MMICSSPVVHVPLIIIIVICSLVAIMSFVGRAALLSLYNALLTLRTGRFFARITQKGPNKSGAAAQISG
jgi:hypothetical protein